MQTIEERVCGEFRTYTATSLAEVGFRVPDPISWHWSSEAVRDALAGAWRLLNRERTELMREAIAAPERFAEARAALDAASAHLEAVSAVLELARRRLTSIGE